MTKIMILGAPQSPLVWAARMAALEKGIDAELVFMMPHTPDITRAQPFGKMPAMRHGDYELGESRAICRYIDGLGAANPLMPPNPQAAASAEQWIMHYYTEYLPVMLGRYIAQYFFPAVPGQPDRAIIEAALAPMEKCFTILDKRLDGRDYLAGTFSLADILYGPLLYYLAQMPESGAMMAKHPRVSAYHARLAARPAYQATLPPPMPSRAKEEAAA